jgi:hypothetical protein
VPFPSPPWQLHAQAWLSVFVLRGTSREDRPPGMYGAAFVDYGPGSVLTYHELLVARLVRDGVVPRIRITEIWVDSEESMAGGRSLWAIPKQLADLPASTDTLGLVERATFSGVAQGQHLATASFTSAPAVSVVRAPAAASLSQLDESGSEVVTSMSGSARALPCLGSWRLDPDGPLAFLHGHRPVLSFRLRDARLRFG